MPNILYLTETAKDEHEYIEEIEQTLKSGGLKTRYIRFGSSIIFTDHATLYVKSLNGTTFGTLPRIDYYASKMDLKNLDDVQRDIFKDCVTIKFSENAQNVTVEEVVKLLTGERM